MISIIGAGPAAASTAINLADHHDVSIYEEHDTIGSPVACTGILTDSLQGHAKLKNDYIINRIKKFEVFGENKSSFFTVKGENIILDRMKFDQDLIQQAVDKGVKIYPGHRMEEVYMRPNNIGLKFRNGETKNTDILIGADGPVSSVAKQTGLFKNRDFLVGMQCLAKGDFDKDVIQVYMTKSPGMFAWVVPENEEVARVGVATKGKTKIYLDNFLKFLETKDYHYCKGDDESGVIPKYKLNVKTQLNNRVFLVGDAATQTKNTTAGGIVPGIICGKILANSIIKNKNYQKEWNRAIGKDLRYHYFIRKALDSFSTKDHDSLINILNKQRSRNLIETFDREFPSKFAKKMVLTNLSLLSFVKNFRI